MNSAPNPLLSALRQRWHTLELPISEHALMTQLADVYTPLPLAWDSPALLLFQKHFLLMNALYRLQLEWQERGWYLQVSALAIDLQTARPAQGRDAVAGSDQALRDYYLDWQAYRGTTSNDVEKLLESFWQRYLAPVAPAELRAAYALLELEAGADWPAVQQAYRRRVQAAHPDRGGDGNEFIRLREAYELLRQATRC